METEAKKKIQQLTGGIHLVCVVDAILIKNEDGTPKTTEKGDMGITVRFADGNNLSIDRDYWRKDGQWNDEFKAMCDRAGIDITQPKFKKESKGKRMWLFVREVHDVTPNGDPILDELTGKPVINYEIFDYQPFSHALPKPTSIGNPQTEEDGKASYDFYTINTIWPKDVKPKAEIIAEQKQMIKQVESGMTTQEVDPFAEEKQPIEQVVELDPFEPDPFEAEVISGESEDRDILPDVKEDEIDWDNI